MKKVINTLSFTYELRGIKIVDGITRVFITDTQTGEIFEGCSECSEADGFDYEVGVNIATRRAVQKMIATQLDFDNRVDGNDINDTYLVNGRIAY